MRVLAFACAPEARPQRSLVMLDIASQHPATPSSASQNAAARDLVSPCRSKGYSLRSLASPVIVRRLDLLAAQEHCTDAEILAHIAELDSREHYLSQGY